MDSDDADDGNACLFEKDPFAVALAMPSLLPSSTLQNGKITTKLMNNSILDSTVARH